MTFIREKERVKLKMQSKTDDNEILKRINALPLNKKQLVLKFLSWLEKRNDYPSLEFIEIR